jgi:hypothetical protein
MSRSYREQNIEHQIRPISTLKNNAKTSKILTDPDDEDGVTCPHCKKFCTYIYLARNSQCYNCKTEINIDE